MKRFGSAFTVVVTVALCLTLIFTHASFAQKQKVKVGFLVHDLVSERWKMDMENFAIKVESLGGEPVMKNAYGDAHTQVTQGKMLVDEGVKVIAVVSVDGKILGELVDYANRAGAVIIAYDRVILNCDLPYYISFNSVKVGELMAEFALKQKPTGNYIILNGPSTDNNALLVRQGVGNKLNAPINSGAVKILYEKEVDSWYALSSLMAIDEFLPTNKKAIDVVIAGSDDLATGAIDAIRASRLPMPVVTGQDATIDACKNIILGFQSMTVYKSIKKLSSEAAILAMKIAKGEKPHVTATINNGKRDVPSILFDPVVVDKSNLQKTVVADGHMKETDLK